MEKIARICWNTEQWTRPSGREGKSLSKDSYENKIGFGHEEWLLDFKKYTDGYHYAFLQPMNVDSGKHVGEKYDIHLFTISPQKQRLYIGCLHNAEGVSKEDSKKVYAYYKKKGWIKEIEKEILDAGGIVEDLNPEMMFNVRFRRREAKLNLSNPPVLKHDRITKHYVLQTKDFPFEFEKDEEGNNLIFNTEPIVRINKEGVKIITPRHKEIQSAVCQILSKDYKDIKAEETFENNYRQRIDICGIQKTTGELHYFEVKTSSAKNNIREALGQILEYAHYPTKNRAKKLFIVGDIMAEDDDVAYLRQLRKLYHIPIWYRWYNESDNTLSDEI